jgi:hypothetical protein
MSPDTAADGAEHVHAKPRPTPEERACLATLTQQAAAATARFADVRAAIADGYARDPAKPNATHYANRAYNIDGAIMDLARPETLVYATRDTGETVLAGVMFKMPRGQSGPQPCGAATTWHTHTTCIDPGTRERMENVHTACADGWNTHESVEMMHLWFIKRGERA